ncbi:unnamed protein product [Ambrosiozyma monospora]|uniref:Unnamed protein product n=1 Tax=Ambrosiozyma monospora TaxID=43982 RepID=A0ACB5TZA9_AMBMO|nr:unnamed protein product [Ambrosiozyma monospora]
MGDSVFPRSLSIEEVHSIVSIERSKSTRSIKSLKKSLAMSAPGVPGSCSGLPKSGSAGSGSGSISTSASSRSIVEMLKNGDHDEFDELVIPDGSGRVLVRSPSGHSVKLPGLAGIGANCGNGSGLKSKRNSILKNRQFDSSTSLHSIIESESRIGVSKLAHPPVSAPVDDDEEEEEDESDHDLDIEEPEVDYIGRIGAATPRSEISAGDGCTIKGDSHGDGDSYEAKDVDELISMMDFSKGDEELDTDFDMDVNIDSPNAADDDDLYSIYDDHKKLDGELNVNIVRNN